MNPFVHLRCLYDGDALPRPARDAYDWSLSQKPSRALLAGCICSRSVTRYMMLKRRLPHSLLVAIHFILSPSSVGICIQDHHTRHDAPEDHFLPVTSQEWQQDDHGVNPSTLRCRRLHPTGCRLSLPEGDSEGRWPDSAGIRPVSQYFICVPVFRLTIANHRYRHDLWLPLSA